MTPGVLLMLTATTAGGLFGVKLAGVATTPTGESGGDDETAEIFVAVAVCCGGMSIVRVSFPKMSRKRFVGAGNADGECCFGGVV